MRALERVVSGGQTGVDRAALDAALEVGAALGGWCPAGRRAEDGRIADRYPLRETPAADPAERTEWNVRDSDATLVVAGDEPSPGTERTREAASRLGRPVYTCPAASPPDAAAFQRWMEINRIRTLNVAGPRESESPGIDAAARDLLRNLFTAV